MLRIFIWLSLFLSSVPLIFAQTEAEGGFEMHFQRQNAPDQTEVVRERDWVKMKTESEGRFRGRVFAVEDSALVVKERLTGNKIRVNLSKQESFRKWRRGSGWAARIVGVLAGVGMALTLVISMLFLAFTNGNAGLAFLTTLGLGFIYTLPLMITGFILWWVAWRKIRLAEWKFRQKKVPGDKSE